MNKIERSFTALPKPHRDDGAVGEPAPKRGWFELPDGALAIGFLLLLSSLCGALIAVYWPSATGISESGLNDRLSTLETKVDQIAAGHASKAAVLAFAGARSDLSLLKARLDADEARLAAMEKSQAVQDNEDLSSLKASAEKDASDLHNLSNRLVGLEQKTATLESKSQGPLRGAFDDRSQALRDAISRFGERLSALEKSAPPADLAQRLDSFALRGEETALETRILKLEAQDMAAVMRRAAAVMALADLVRASAGGEPFLDEFAALRALAPASPELEDLSRYAARGVPTRTMLAESFNRQAESILGTEHPANSGKTFGDRIWSGVMSVVPVHPIGSIIGNDPEARVSRAQADLNLGELARAIREVSALQGPARDAAAPWLKSANERLNVDRDARVLAQKLVAHLSTTPGLPAGAGK